MASTIRPTIVTIQSNVMWVYVTHFIFSFIIINNNFSFIIITNPT